MRLVRSTIHLTGKPSNDTKQMIIDLLAPARSQVVASTAAATAITSSAPSSTQPSNSDPAALEEGGNYSAATLRDFPGVLRGDDVSADKKSEHSSDEDEAEEGITERPSGLQERWPSLDKNNGAVVEVREIGNDKEPTDDAVRVVKNTPSPPNRRTDSESVLWKEKSWIDKQSQTQRVRVSSTSVSRSRTL